MAPKILSLAAAAAIAVGASAAVPAAAASPGSPGAAKLAGAPQTAASVTTQAVPVRHYYRNGRYCRRQYRLGFVLGRRGARVFFNRHCHPRWRGRHWRGRHWDRGYHRGHRRGYRRRHRNYQNQR